MKTTFHWMIGGVMALTLAAGGVLAAESEWVVPEAGRPQTAYGWGPYTGEGTALPDRTLERYGWSPADEWLVQPYATLIAIHDDNVTLNSRERSDDNYLTFTPGVLVLRGNPRQDYLYLDYSADFSTLNVDGSDALDGQSVTAAVNQQNAKSQATLTHRYRDVQDLDVQVGTRLRRKTNITTAGFDDRVTAKTALGILGQFSDNQYDDSAYSDYREYTAAGRVSWQMMPRASLYGQAGHGWVDVDESRDAYGSAQYDEVSLGIFGHPRPRLETSGQVGVQHRYFEDSRIGDITREVGSLRVAGEPFELFRTWVNLSAGLRPAINSRGYTVFDTRVEPGVSRRLFTDRLVGALSFVWGRSEYLGVAESGDTTDAQVYDGRRDVYWGLNANLDYWLGHYWCVGLGYSFFNNDSNADGREVDGQAVDPASYDANRVMLKVSFNR